MRAAQTAIIARTVPAPVTIALYVAAAVYDAISTIALLFNLAPSEIGSIPQVNGKRLRHQTYHILGANGQDEAMARARAQSGRRQCFLLRRLP